MTHLADIDSSTALELLVDSYMRATPGNIIGYRPHPLEVTLPRQTWRKWNCKIPRYPDGYLHFIGYFTRFAGDAGRGERQGVAAGDSVSDIFVNRVSGALPTLPVKVEELPGVEVGQDRRPLG
jgi:hypothetical protein